MHFLQIGTKTFNMSRFVYADDALDDDDKPMLVCFFAGLRRRDQPVFLQGDERLAMLQVLPPPGGLHVCDDCRADDAAREAN